MPGCEPGYAGGQRQYIESCSGLVGCVEWWSSVASQLNILSPATSAIRFRRDLRPDLFNIQHSKWLAGEAGPPVLYRHHACGEISSVDLRCTHCGEPMHATDIAVLPGPGAAI
jgi:hypothetical protein